MKREMERARKKERMAERGRRAGMGEGWWRGGGGGEGGKKREWEEKGGGEREGGGGERARGERTVFSCIPYS